MVHCSFISFFPSFYLLSLLLSPCIALPTKKHNKQKTRTNKQQQQQQENKKDGEVADKNSQTEEFKVMQNVPEHI